MIGNESDSSANRQDDTAKWIGDFVKRWKKRIDGKFEEWELHERLYRVRIDPEKKGRKSNFSRSNTMVMEFHRDIESVVCAEMITLFNDAPFFHVEPKAFIDDVAYERAKVEASISQQMHERFIENNGFRRATQTLLRMSAKYGTAFAKTEWEYREKYKFDPTAEDGGSYVPVPYCDQPILTPIPPWRVAIDVDSFVNDINDCEHIVELTEMTKRQIKGLISAFEKVPSAKTTPFEKLTALSADVSETNEDYDDRTYRQDSSVSDTAETIRQNRGYDEGSSKKYDVKIHYGKHPYMKDVELDFIIFTLNDMDVLVEVPMVDVYPHGFYPISITRFIELEDDAYGIGLGHILSWAQLELNERRNMSLDLLVLALHGIWTRTGGAGVATSNKLRVHPGMIIDSVREGNLAPVRVPMEPINASMMMEGAVKEDMRFSSGATTTTQGMSSSGEETAYEVRTIAAEASKKLAQLSMNFAEDVFRPYFTQAHELAKDNLELPMIIRLTGAGEEQLLDLMRTDLLPDPDFSFKLATDLDFRTQMIRRLSSALKIMVDASTVVPMIQQYVPDTVEHMLRLLGVRIRPPQQQVMAPQLAGPGGAPLGATPPPGMPPNQGTSAGNAPSQEGTVEALLMDALQKGGA